MNEAGLDASPREPADGTLGGYLATHDRPPAFEGSDGYPYTVSLEIERTGDLRSPYSGYLVFPRWAQTGVGIVGHVVTQTLATGRSEDEVREPVEAMTLHDVQALLEEAITASQSDFDA